MGQIKLKGIPEKKITVKKTIYGTTLWYGVELTYVFINKKTARIVN